MKACDVIIYTDGSSRGNPGPGGYGIIMEDCKSGFVKEYSKGFRYTTNNRMELLAVIDALKMLKKNKLKVLIYTDSKYVVDSVEKKWVFKWKTTNFKNKKNVDLWLDFLKLFDKNTIKFNWIKGHNNHPQNEKCDKLAFDASKSKNSSLDLEYEKINKPL
ncbi:MAG: ribonuclease HI [Flavobacteriaceae bacterium]|jgi:ribonuclease HI|tara:strand:- start:100 stop:579 length:480 start_codon:yes stop_codon:yes gene_type:complete